MDSSRMMSPGVTVTTGIFTGTIRALGQKVRIPWDTPAIKRLKMMRLVRKITGVFPGPLPGEVRLDKRNRTFLKEKMPLRPARLPAGASGRRQAD